MYVNQHVVDDEGLRQLLLLPPDADLPYYRERSQLPYFVFKCNGQVHYRYLVGEVLEWAKRRQHNMCA
jgi:hypothetical protein